MLLRADYIGHKYKWAWENHKHHHAFFNPSPFSVIADEYVDQFVRSLPLVLIPLLAPVNQDARGRVRAPARAEAAP